MSFLSLLGLSDPASGISDHERPHRRLPGPRHCTPGLYDLGPRRSATGAGRELGCVGLGPSTLAPGMVSRGFFSALSFVTERTESGTEADSLFPQA